MTRKQSVKSSTDSKKVGYMNRDTAIAILFSLLLAILAIGVLEIKAPRIAVEIYLSEGELIYCATGTLDSPAKYMGSGTVAKGQESYC